MQTVLTMTERGVISLPKKIRNLLGLNGKDHLIAEVRPEGLLLKQAVTLPVEMYSDARIKAFDKEEEELATMLKKKKSIIHDFQRLTPMRIFLDANILFSVAKSDGAIRFLITGLLSAGHELRINPFVQEEAVRNLRAKAPAALEYFEVLLLQVSSIPLVDFKPLPKEASCLPVKDQPVLQAALHDECDVLLTGDRTHFGSLYGQKIESVVVHSPRSLGELIFP